MPVVHRFGGTLDNDWQPIFHGVMANFSVIILTAPPPGQATEAGGAVHRSRWPGKPAAGGGIVSEPRKYAANSAGFHGRYGRRGQAEIWRASFVFRREGALGRAEVVGSDFCGIGKSFRRRHPCGDSRCRPAGGFLCGYRFAAGGLGKKFGGRIGDPVLATSVEMDEGNNPIAITHPPRFVQLLTPQVFSVAKKLKELAVAGGMLQESRS